MSKSSQESSPITQWTEKLEDMLLQLQAGTMYADNTEPATTNNRNIATQAITSATIELIEGLIGEDTYPAYKDGKIVDYLGHLVASNYTSSNMADYPEFNTGANTVRSQLRQSLKEL